MNKLFEKIRGLRPRLKSGEISREEALNILKQETGTSGGIADQALENMLKDTPEGGGITEVFFGPGDKRFKRLEPYNPSVEERTGGMLKETEEGKYIKNPNFGLSKLNFPSRIKTGEDPQFDTVMSFYDELDELNDEGIAALQRESEMLGAELGKVKTGEAEKYSTMLARKDNVDGILNAARIVKEGRDGSFETMFGNWKRANKKNDPMMIETPEDTKANKDRFDYDMAVYRQQQFKKKKPFYDQYGAKTEHERRFLDEFIQENDEQMSFGKQNSKYKSADVRLFIQETFDDLGGVDSNKITNILYSDKADRIIQDQGFEGFIDYAKKELQGLGLEFNDELLKKVLRDGYKDEFSTGGRVGFDAGGSGKKYKILSVLEEIGNIIAPGSTKVGKLSKSPSDKALRKKAEVQLTQDINNFMKKYPSKPVDINEPYNADIGSLEEFYNDFVKAGGNPDIDQMKLMQAYRLKKRYPFNTPYIDKDGKVIGGEATQQMYPKSPKFMIEDRDKLMEQINDMREGKMPRTPDGERTGLDVPPVPEGFKLSKEKLMAKFPEIDEKYADEIMGMDKNLQGRIIKMLENRRLDPIAYDRLLEIYGDTLEFQKEFDKVVRRKQNASGGLNYLMGL